MIFCVWPKTLAMWAMPVTRVKFQEWVKSLNFSLLPSFCYILLKYDLLKQIYHN